jgi:hypothetical protein
MIILAFAVCTYWHSQRGTRAGLALLWMLTAALWLSVVLGAAWLEVRSGLGEFARDLPPQM